MNESSCLIVCTTLPETFEVEEFARVLVEERLTACVQMFVPVKSVYRWKEEIEWATERPVQIKTTTRRIDALISRIRRLHPYEVPEILIFAVDKAGQDYENWIRKETAATGATISDEAKDNKTTNEEEKK